MASLIWGQSPTLSYRGLIPSFEVDTLLSPDVKSEDVDDLIFKITAMSSEPNSSPVEVSVSVPLKGVVGSYNITHIVLAAVKNLAYRVTLSDYPAGLVKIWRSTEVDLAAEATAYMKSGETLTTNGIFRRRFYLSKSNHPDRDDSLDYYDVANGRWFPSVTIGGGEPNKRFYAKDKDGNEYDSYAEGGIIFLECTEEIAEVGVKDGQFSYKTRALPRYWNNGLVLRFWDSTNGGYRSIVAECGSTTDADIQPLGTFERKPFSLDEPRTLGNECELIKTITIRGNQKNRHGYTFDDLVGLTSSLSTEFYEDFAWRPCFIEGDLHSDKNGFFTFTGTVRVGYKNILKWL